MKKPKKVIGWFLIVASGFFLLFAVLSSDTENSDSHNQTASPTGNNSPAIIISGSSNTVNQAAPGAIINNGASDETLQKIINLKDAELYERTQSEYPYGCIVVGLQNDSHLIYGSDFRGIQTTFDPNAITFSVTNGIAHIKISNFTVIDSVHFNKFYGNTRGWVVGSFDNHISNQHIMI